MNEVSEFAPTYSLGPDLATMLIREEIFVAMIDHDLNKATCKTCDLAQLEQWENPALGVNRRSLFFSKLKATVGDDFIEDLERQFQMRGTERR